MEQGLRIVGDRLYSISMRPQELAIYGDRVHFELRYSPIFDDPEAEQREHFKLMVLQIRCDLPADDELGIPERQLELFKCGWELELSSERSLRAADIGELPQELPRVLGRIADTANELARRSGLEAPLAPELIDSLLAEYRQRSGGGSGS